MTVQTATRSADVARIVRTLLTYRGEGQEGLARHLGVDQSAISKALNGRRRWSLDEVAAMAEFFDVSPVVFFESPEALLRSRCFSDPIQDDSFHHLDDDVA